jgi:hypothetical protein
MYLVIASKECSHRKFVNFKTFVKQIICEFEVNIRNKAFIITSRNVEH